MSMSAFLCISFPTLVRAVLMNSMGLPSTLIIVANQGRNNGGMTGWPGTFRLFPSPGALHVATRVDYSETVKLVRGRDEKSYKKEAGMGTVGQGPQCIKDMA